MLRRDFIGFEKEKSYIEAAEERILKVKPLTHELLSLKIDEKKLKVPFGNLIEKGIIFPGAKLYSKNKEYSAIVLANGALLWENIEGSIHKVSAEILNKSSNNGWLYWYIDDGRQLKVIDSLRDQYIKKFIN